MGIHSNNKLRSKRVKIVNMKCLEKMNIFDPKMGQEETYNLRRTREKSKVGFQYFYNIKKKIRENDQSIECNESILRYVLQTTNLTKYNKNDRNTALKRYYTVFFKFSLYPFNQKKRENGYKKIFSGMIRKFNDHLVAPARIKNEIAVKKYVVKIPYDLAYSINLRIKPMSYMTKNMLMKKKDSYHRFEIFLFTDQL